MTPEPHAVLAIELHYTEGQPDVGVILRDLGPHPFTREAAIAVLTQTLNALKLGEGEFIGGEEQEITREAAIGILGQTVNDLTLGQGQFIGGQEQEMRIVPAQDSAAKNQSASRPADVNRNHS